MQILVNGETVDIVSPISLQTYIEKLGMSCQSVVVEYNGKIPPKEKWQEIILQEGDKLEIVHFVGGG